MKSIIIINGPNLDLLGERQPEIYGSTILAELNRQITAHAEKLGCQVVFYQTNSESEIIDLLHRHRTGVGGIIINPGGYGHTSVAILDALLALEVPAVEVHLSNLYKREEFRQELVTARGVVGIISGFGKEGYLLALTYLAGNLKG
jgi:3-dehydroquinate dehydratase-2